MKIDINYVIPLGSQCFSAFFLKKYNLKYTSYPFDWIFSNPYIILDMLNDNFEKFLNKNYYVFKNENDEKNKHSIYLTDLYMFNHRNPIKDEDYLYYLRCINRFYKVLQKKEKKLFIMTLLNNEIKNELDNIILLKSKFDTMTTNSEFVFIFQKTAGYQSKDVYIHENIIIIQINTISDSDGIIFTNENDYIFYKEIIDSFYDFKLLEIDF
jgi:hypothetical protein